MPVRRAHRGYGRHRPARGRRVDHRRKRWDYHHAGRRLRRARRPHRPMMKVEHVMTETTTLSQQQILLDEDATAHNYHPLPVVAATASGAWVTDVEGHRYLDCLAGYSALNFGHRHPLLVAAAHAQLDRLTLTSRAFHNDRLGPFMEDLAALTGTERVLPMNTGAEAVETAIKISRAWGYRVKGVRADRAKIVVASNSCLLYTSDAADDLTRVDLGGRRNM